MPDVVDRESWYQGFGTAFALVGVALLIGGGVFLLRGGDIKNLLPLEEKSQVRDPQAPWRLNLGLGAEAEDNHRRRLLELNFDRE